MSDESSLHAVREFKQICIQATLECSDSFDVTWQAVTCLWAGHCECLAGLDSRPWHQEVAVGGRADRSSCWHAGDWDAQ